MSYEAPIGSIADNRSSRAYELVSRAGEFLRTGHPHQAAMLLTEAKLIEPQKGSIREALGRAHYLCGRPARARREFAKAVEIDPVNDYAHFGLALSCARTGERTRAIAHLKLAIAMRPTVDEYREALARIAG
ncbi:MAG TPA: tetratricopeptide repeat protein [Actinomycetota bacterium]|nr:tetratricopeptide repeat protein [Actinomycetota bacterium]